MTGEWNLGPFVEVSLGPVLGMDLDPDEPLRRVEEMGEHDPDVQTYTYGNFPEAGGGVTRLFTPSKIDSALARTIAPKGAKDVGIDVAGSGRTARWATGSMMPATASGS